MQVLFPNGHAPLPAVPASGQLPWCPRVVLDLFLQLLSFHSLMVITLHTDAGYHTWSCFFSPWLLHTCKISACTTSTEAKYILICVCAAPAAGFLHLGPDNMLYIAKGFLSQQPISTKIIGERHCSEKQDATAKQCQWLQFISSRNDCNKRRKTTT